MAKVVDIMGKFRKKKVVDASNVSEHEAPTTRNPDAELNFLAEEAKQGVDLHFLVQ